MQDPHHSGRITAQRDLVQKKTLEWNGLRVIDIQHYNCPNIMKENSNKDAMRELLEALNHEGIH